MPLPQLRERCKETAHWSLRSLATTSERLPWNSRRCRRLQPHYVADGRGGRLAAARHLAYLNATGPSATVHRAGSTVLTSLTAAPWRAARGREAPIPIHRLPEDANGALDLQAFRLRAGRAMEKDPGRRPWGPRSTTTTPNILNVHLVAWGGVDAEGEELGGLPRRYIQQDMRARAQQILTGSSGCGTEAGWYRAQQCDTRSAKSATSIIYHPGLDFGTVFPGHFGVGLKVHQKPTVLACLRTLVRLPLAAATGATVPEPGVRAGTYRLSGLGLRNDIFIKRLHQGHLARRALPVHRAGPISRHPSRAWSGRGLHDELTGELFAAVETKTGELTSVRLTTEAAEFVGDGDIIRVGPDDGVLDQADGLRPREGHGEERRRLMTRRRTSSSSRPPAGRTHHRATFVAGGNVRRLERLERYGPRRLIAR